MTPITYLSEQPLDYVRELDACDTLPDLVGMLERWQAVAKDALAVARTMTDADFSEWRAGLASERRGEFAGEAFAIKFGAVLLPRTLIEVASAAVKFGVPWGCAYIRLKEEGQLSS